MSTKSFQDVAEPLVSKVLIWGGNPTQMTRVQATRLVALFMLNNPEEVDDFNIFDTLVRMLITKVNKHVDLGLSMTVGELKKRLEGVLDTTPVAYQRIEDVYFEKHNWDQASIKLTWDSRKLESMQEYEAWPPEAKAGTKLETRADGLYAIEQSTYVAAYNAFADKDDDGCSVFRIDGHY
jgi:hypothetical protein